MTGSEKTTRRNLPHWFRPGAAHFVTYRLHGTIPIHVLHNLRKKRGIDRRRLTGQGLRTDQARETTQKMFFAAYDRYLDENTEVDWLRCDEIAAMIRENLLHHHKQKYFLLAYCIMVNHAHVLLLPIAVAPASEKSVVIGRQSGEWFSDETADARSPLAKIMHSLKSYTANRANEILGRSGRFWQSESYDHWVRDAGELYRIVEYIHQNPVRPRLVETPEDWKWSTAYERRHGLFDPWKDAEGLLD
jgi:putative DNA methylase